jgi:hypothetical protein
MAASIGALPKKWARRVLDVGRQHNHERQQLKLIETLNKLKSATLPRDFDFDGGRPWQDQAFEAHVQKPFDALLLNGANAHPAAIEDGPTVKVQP